jgi:hypothetical protein
MKASFVVRLLVVLRDTRHDAFLVVLLIYTTTCISQSRKGENKEATLIITRKQYFTLTHSHCYTHCYDHTTELRPSSGLFLTTILPVVSNSKNQQQAFTVDSIFVLPSTIELIAVVYTSFFTLIFLFD